MRRTLALLAVAFLLPSCAGLLGEPSDRASEQERSDLAAALARAETDPRATERRLADFLQKWPESPLADDAALRRAELALERGDQAAARHRYALVIERYPDGDRIDSARVALAKIESARGDRDSAAALLGQTRFGQLDADERQAAYRLLADVARDPVARLRWLSRLRAGETDEDAIALIDVEIDETVLRLEDSDLDRAADQLGNDLIVKLRNRQSNLIRKSIKSVSFSRVVNELLRKGLNR